jgi:hypothetical protein
MDNSTSIHCWNCDVCIRMHSILNVALHSSISNCWLSLSNNSSSIIGIVIITRRSSKMFILLSTLWMQQLRKHDYAIMLTQLHVYILISISNITLDYQLMTIAHGSCIVIVYMWICTKRNILHNKIHIGNCLLCYH